jgi:hypothetical protein
MIAFFGQMSMQFPYSSKRIIRQKQQHKRSEFRLVFA